MGLNHKTAPVALRECLAFSEDETDTSLEALKTLGDIEEVGQYVVAIETEQRVRVEQHRRNRGYKHHIVSKTMDGSR